MGIFYNIQGENGTIEGTDLSDTASECLKFPFVAQVTFTGRQKCVGNTDGNYHPLKWNK